MSAVCLQLQLHHLLYYCNANYVVEEEKDRKISTQTTLVVQKIVSSVFAIYGNRPMKDVQIEPVDDII